MCESDPFAIGDARRQGRCVRDTGTQQSRWSEGNRVARWVVGDHTGYRRRPGSLHGKCRAAYGCWVHRTVESGGNGRVGTRRIGVADRADGDNSRRNHYRAISSAATS